MNIGFKIHESAIFHDPDRRTNIANIHRPAGIDRGVDNPGAADKSKSGA